MQMQSFSLKGKTVLITGGSSGIGKATAILCAEAGARIILLGRNVERLQEVHVNLAGNDHLAIAIDLTDHEKVKKKLTDQLQDIPHIHGLVHAAGITSTYPFKLMKPEQMQHYFETNVYSGFYLSSLLIKKMRKEPASMIFITSVMASVGEKAKSLYAMTKGALLSGSKSLAIELAGNNIRVNCISPGIVDTPMTENATYKKDEQLLQDTLSLYPLGFGLPEDVANASLFLLSDASKWITGIDLKVDGGYTAR